MTAADVWEYQIIYEGSAKKATRKLEEAERDGWSLVEFRTGGYFLGYHFVFLLRRRKEQP